MTQREGDAGLPWYRQFWPWFVLAIPGLTVVAGILVTLLSLSGADDLVVDNYYREGLAVNRRLEEDRLAASLQATATLQIDRQSGALQCELRGNFPSAPTALSLALIHPMSAAADTVMQLEPQGNGRYATTLSPWPDGPRYVDLTAQLASGQRIRLRGRYQGSSPVALSPAQP